MRLLFFLLVFLCSSFFHLSEIYAQGDQDNSFEIIIGGKKYNSFREYKKEQIKEVLREHPTLTAEDFEQSGFSGYGLDPNNPLDKFLSVAVEDLSDDDLRKLVNELKNRMQGRLNEGEFGSHYLQTENLLQNYEKEHGFFSPVTLDVNKMKTIIIQPTAGQDQDAFYRKMAFQEEEFFGLDRRHLELMVQNYSTRGEGMLAQKHTTFNLNDVKSIFGDAFQTPHVLLNEVLEAYLWKQTQMYPTYFQPYGIKREGTKVDLSMIKNYAPGSISPQFSGEDFKKILGELRKGYRKSLKKQAQKLSSRQSDFMQMHNALRGSLSTQAEPFPLIFDSEKIETLNKFLNQKQPPPLASERISSRKRDLEEILQELSNQELKEIIQIFNERHSEGSPSGFSRHKKQVHSDALSPNQERSHLNLKAIYLKSGAPSPYDGANGANSFNSPPDSYLPPIIIDRTTPSQDPSRPRTDINDVLNFKTMMDSSK